MDLSRGLGDVYKRQVLNQSENLEFTPQLALLSHLY
jgi:hypothetical protein